MLQPIVLDAIADYLRDNSISLAKQLAIRAQRMTDTSAKGKLVEFVLVAGLVEATVGQKLGDLPPFSGLPAEAGWLAWLSSTMRAKMSTRYTLPLPEGTVNPILQFYF